MRKMILWLGVLFFLSASSLQAKLEPKDFEKCQNDYQNCMTLSNGQGYSSAKKSECTMNFNQCLKNQEAEKEKKAEEKPKEQFPPMPKDFPGTPDDWESFFDGRRPPTEHPYES